METIHYIGDFSYIKDENHLREAINYITRNFKLSKSLTTLNRDKLDIWLQRAKDEKAIRKNSQIALRFHLALPNDQINNKEFRKKVVKKLIEMFNIPSNHIDVAFHLDSYNNYHMHVLIYPRGKDGKKLRLKKNDLARIHKEWDLFLQNEGYQIKRKNTKRKSICKYMKDKMVEMGYLPIHPVAIDQETMNKAKERFLKEMKKRNIEIKEADIKLFEDLIEEKAIQMEENKLIQKMIKTKEYLKEKVSLNWNNNNSSNNISISRNP
jgi:hypothetical protein